jgi:hypothetical protein
MTFRVGQKVVCMDDKPELGKRWTYKKPHLGRTYQVTACYVDDDSDEVVRLRGMRRAPHPGYLASRFRPVVELGTETGMAILRNLLETKQREDA